MVAWSSNSDILTASFVTPVLLLYYFIRKIVLNTVLDYLVIDYSNHFCQNVYVQTFGRRPMVMSQRELRMTNSLPPVCRWERSPRAAWCCGHSPGRWSSRRPGGPTGTGCKCQTGTIPGGRGRPGSRPCSQSARPGRGGGLENKTSKMRRNEERRPHCIYSRAHEEDHAHLRDHHNEYEGIKKQSEVIGGAKKTTPDQNTEGGGKVWFAAKFDSVSRRRS